VAGADQKRAPGQIESEGAEVEPDSIG